MGPAPSSAASRRCRHPARQTAGREAKQRVGMGQRRHQPKGLWLSMFVSVASRAAAASQDLEVVGSKRLARRPPGHRRLTCWVSAPGRSPRGGTSRRPPPTTVAAICTGAAAGWVRHQHMCLRQFHCLGCAQHRQSAAQPPPQHVHAPHSKHSVAEMRTCQVSVPSQGSLKVRSSHITTPNENTSLAAVADPPLITSGACTGWQRQNMQARLGQRLCCLPAYLPARRPARLPACTTGTTQVASQAQSGGHSPASAG